MIIGKVVRSTQIYDLLERQHKVPFKNKCEVKKGRKTKINRSLAKCSKVPLSYHAT